MMKLPPAGRRLLSTAPSSAGPARISRQFLRLGAVLLVALPAIGTAASDQAAKYPFDPACPWGRLSNGKGMLHRCISEAEARSVAEGSKKAADKKSPSSEKKSPKGEKGGTSDAKAPVQSLPKDYDITLGPIQAEQGEITIGRLELPMDRYRQCVDENGGLKAKQAKVVVKFLVRAELSRAEGVSVESYEKVSDAAAECIAAVVDRRQVGEPTEPITAARLTFQLKEKP